MKVALHRRVPEKEMPLIIIFMHYHSLFLTFKFFSYYVQIFIISSKTLCDLMWSQLHFDVIFQMCHFSDGVNSVNLIYFPLWFCLWLFLKLTFFTSQNNLKIYLFIPCTILPYISFTSFSFAPLFANPIATRCFTAYYPINDFNLSKSIILRCQIIFLVILSYLCCCLKLSSLTNHRLDVTFYLPP